MKKEMIDYLHIAGSVASITGISIITFENAYKDIDVNIVVTYIIFSFSVLGLLTLIIWIFKSIHNWYLKKIEDNFLKYTLYIFSSILIVLFGLLFFSMLKELFFPLVKLILTGQA